MVRTFVADASLLLDEKKWNYYYQAAPAERRQKADKAKKTKDKCQSLGVWSLYKIICEKYQISADCIYNFSHSGDYVMCSISDDLETDVQVGCDIEQIKKPPMKLAERYFCPMEYEYIISRETEQGKAEAFYRYWVLKESFMKATRLGTRLALDAFEILAEGQETPILLRQPSQFSTPYYYKEYTMDGLPYKMAVCSTINDIASGVIIEGL